VILEHVKQLVSNITSFHGLEEKVESMKTSYIGDQLFHMLQYHTLVVVLDIVPLIFYRQLARFLVN
jgi:hypothetical protein